VSNKTNDHHEELAAGQMLGRYELLVPIAKGGMGNVWAARLKGTRGFRKLVAIKTVLRTLEHAEREQMLFQEAVLASQIHHSNVAETLELGEHEGTLYLVMELVSGESLRFILREAQAHGGMPLSVSISLIGQVCRGLAAAHDLRDENGESVGLVHRDISPPNVMITDAGTVKIVDFGVATTASSGLDPTGEIRGKISYLAPEQLRGEAPDARVDVFATGILLYLLTVGRHPFRTASESTTISRILSKAPATTPSALVEDYPDALEQIVMRALHKDRRERFQSIAAMLEALQNAFPNAFGPRADQSSALFLQQLMKDRILERKATLRMAEETAEKSSPRNSAYSLPVVMTSLPVTASSAPQAQLHRGALLGLGGLLTGLGGAALATSLYLHGLPPAALGAATSLTSRDAAATAATEMSAAVLTPDRTGVGGSSPATPTVVASVSTLVSNAPARPKRPLAGRATRDEPEAIGTETEPRVTSTSPAPEALAARLAEPALAGSALPQNERDTSSELAALLPTPSTAPPPAKAAPTQPRLLSSKLGQAQLLTNPAAAKSRVRLPVGLDRMGETFSALVSICVSAGGSVSKVDILRSAGPALDPQIPSALSRWQYRPLLQDGKPTPFCYVLNYEIGAR